MIKKLKAALAVVLVFALMTGCTFVYVGDVATVNGEKVYHETFKYMAALTQMYFGAYPENQNAMMLLQYDSVTQSYLQGGISDLMLEIGTANEGENLWDKELADGKTAKDVVADYVYNKAVELKVISVKASELGISLTDAEKESISNFKSQLVSALGSLDAYTKALDSVGVTEKTVDAMYNDILLSEKVRISQLVSDEDGKSYYDQNYLNVKHILVRAGTTMTPDMDSAKAMAEDIIAQLDAGADFEALMQEYSADRDASGNLNSPDGYVFAEGDFGNPAFEDAAAALAVGQYTKTPVEVNTEGSSYQGYHIIKRYALSDDYYTNDTDGIKSAVKSAFITAQIAETEAKPYYEANYTGASYIFVEVTEEKSQDEVLLTANDIIAQLDAGADFDVLLGRYSDDKSTLDGYAYKTSTGMTELDEVLNTLEIGQYAKEPLYIEKDLYGRSGYYIAEKTVLSDAYFDTVKKTISSQILTEKYSQMIDDWCAEYEIEKNQSKVKSVKFNKPAAYM